MATEHWCIVAEPLQVRGSLWVWSCMGSVSILNKLTQVEECYCELAEDKRSKAAALYTAYKTWCEDNGKNDTSGTSLARHDDRHVGACAGLSL